METIILPGYEIGILQDHQIGWQKIEKTSARREMYKGKIDVWENPISIFETISKNEYDIKNRFTNYRAVCYEEIKFYYYLVSNIRNYKCYVSSKIFSEVEPVLKYHNIPLPKIENGEYVGDNKISFYNEICKNQFLNINLLIDGVFCLLFREKNIVYLSPNKLSLIKEPLQNSRKSIRMNEDSIEFYKTLKRKKKINYNGIIYKLPIIDKIWVRKIGKVAICI